jgi:hypothetical protein
VPKSQSHPADSCCPHPRRYYCPVRCPSPSLVLLILPDLCRSPQGICAIIYKYGRHRHTKGKPDHLQTESCPNQQKDDGASTSPNSNQSMPQDMGYSCTKENNQSPMTWRVVSASTSSSSRTANTQRVTGLEAWHYRGPYLPGGPDTSVAQNAWPISVRGRVCPRRDIVVTVPLMKL